MKLTPEEREIELEKQGADDSDRLNKLLKGDASCFRISKPLIPTLTSL
tara:strand:- start:51314 stop:51457 length:144 start_codon:yes stop_codon:yes gene_type:complete